MAPLQHPLLALGFSVSSAVRTLVSAYVRAKNRRALERMSELRRKLLEELQTSSSGSSRHALDQVHDDLRAIEEGLKQLS